MYFFYSDLVFTGTGHCPNFVCSCDWNFEFKYFGTFGCFSLHAIHKECDALLIGINLDLRHIFGTLHIPSATYMDKWSFAPICFIQIKGIFFQLTVDGHKTFLVHTVFSTLISSVCRKIKQIPDMCCPQIRALLDHFCHMLMINTLIFLCVIAPFRICTVVSRIGVCAILGKSDHTIRVRCVIRIKETVVLF